MQDTRLCVGVDAAKGGQISLGWWTWKVGGEDLAEDI